MTINEALTKIFNLAKWADALEVAKAVRSLGIFAFNYNNEMLSVWMAYYALKESGIKNISNADNSAFGYFQIYKSNWPFLNVNPQILSQMTFSEQLKLLEKFSIPYKNIKSFGELYLWLFLPSIALSPNEKFANYIIKANPTLLNINNNPTGYDFIKYYNNKFTSEIGIINEKKKTT